MKPAGILAFSLLAACQTTTPAVEVRTVEVPTPIACITPEQVPAEPPRIGHRLTGNAVADVLIVSKSALELRKWGQEMAALLRGCGG